MLSCYCPNSGCSSQLANEGSTTVTFVNSESVNDYVCLQSSLQAQQAELCTIMGSSSSRTLRSCTIDAPPAGSSSETVPASRSPVTVTGTSRASYCSPAGCGSLESLPSQVGDRHCSQVLSQCCVTALLGHAVTSQGWAYLTNVQV